MEKRYKEILLTNEYGKLLEAKKKGIPAVPCLPVIYAENPITAGNEKIMEKENKPGINSGVSTVSTPIALIDSPLP